jgi:hypothetical protein
METSASLLRCLVGAPTDDDWRRLDDLYWPLLRAWVVRAGVPPSDFDELVQDVLLAKSRVLDRLRQEAAGLVEWGPSA